MNGASNVLLPIALALPVGMLLMCISQYVRSRMPALLALAPVPALAAALLSIDAPSFALPWFLFKATLHLDVSGAMLLEAAAVLWITAAVYAYYYLRDTPDAGNFAAWWLTAMVGNIGVFLSADIASFYLFLAIGSIGAYGLIFHNMTPVSRQAAVVYVGFALVGEATVLIGFVLLAAVASTNDLLIHNAVEALPASSWRDLTLAFLILGFGLKIGLVPLHLWMPLAYTAAPAPGAAVISGIAINAGVIGLIRFLPFTAAQPGLGTALIAAGIISTFYGVVIGINRLNPKTVLAYSSVSQMGVIATLLGVGLATGSNGVTLAAGFYAAHHLLVKGGLFLATGIVVRSGIRLWPVLIPATIVGLALAGLPLTGGFVAKAAVKPFIGEGSFAAFAALSSAGTTVLMLHFINCLTRLQPQTKSEPNPIGLIGPWLVTAFAAITIPWTLLPPAIADGALGILSLQELWSALWPILLGTIAAIAWWYRPLKVYLPSRISLAASLDFARCAMEVCATLVERAEAILRRWQAAGISLLAVATLFILILASGH